MGRAKNSVLTINVANESKLLSARTILGYESGMRGFTIGKTFAQMIEEAANIDAYPEEVRERLSTIQEGIQKQAVEKSLKISA